jgi:hypothetical protein
LWRRVFVFKSRTFHQSCVATFCVQHTLHIACKTMVVQRSDRSEYDSTCGSLVPKVKIYS